MTTEFAIFTRREGPGYEYEGRDRRDRSGAIVAMGWSRGNRRDAEDDASKAIARMGKNALALDIVVGEHASGGWAYEVRHFSGNEEILVGWGWEPTRRKAVLAAGAAAREAITRLTGAAAS